jgi:acetylornithine deacetylase/succinyl-diaminopimelate desuccinylase-like protein
MAHIINEYIAVDDLMAAARGYQAIINGVLGDG